MNPAATTNLWAGVPIGEHLRLFSPLIALVATMLAIVAVPLVLGRGTRRVAATAAIGVALMLFLSLRVAPSVAAQGVSGLAPPSAGGMLIADGLSVGFQVLLAVFLGAVLWMWWMGSADREQNAPEFLILLLGSALGMALMAATSNLLMIVVAIETASLPSYAMVGFDKRDRTGAEASLKYMIFGAISAAIMLYGASLLYGLVGSLDAAAIAQYTASTMGSGPSRLVLYLGLLCFLAGIAFKISAVPFHFWCPDAFEGAKIEVTTWLSVASKAAGLILLTRLAMTLCEAMADPRALGVLSPVAWVLGIMAAITATIGNFSAYKQQSVKRMLAYSSIAHAGYMMMAAAVFVHPDSAGTHAGLGALFAYVVIYMFMNLGAFGVVALVSWESGSDRIEEFTGLARRAPWLAVPFVFCLVSLIGVPPLAGFIGKWWILSALGGLQSSLGWVLVLAAVVNTLISVYFYMRLVVQMTLRDDARPKLPLRIGGAVLVNGCALALLLLFVFAGPLKNSTDRYARNWFRATATRTADGSAVSLALP